MGCRKKIRNTKFCVTGDCYEQDYKKKCRGKPWMCQAHHIVCVASVSAGLLTDKKVEPLARATKWCINEPDHMIGMPLWGATVRYYCKITKATRFFQYTLPAPPFENLPQHDWDHNIKGGYTAEVTDFVEQVGALAADRAHDAQQEDIAGDLDAFCTLFEGELHTRGYRSGGTDKCWWNAVNRGGQPKAGWYLPFSMAEDLIARERPFPLKKDSPSVYAWIGKIAEVLGGGLK